MNDSYDLGKSSQDYLEAILMIQQEKGSCYSIDIANKLNFSKPSVSNAIKKLETEGLIYRDSLGTINFTQQGQIAAQETYDRHLTLTQFLIDLGVDQDTSEQDACLIEHNLSRASFEAIKKLYLTLKKNQQL